jgi:uncharacterized membrane protein
MLVIFPLLFFLIVIAVFAFWIWMLVDCLVSPLPSMDKLVRGTDPLLRFRQ